LESDSIGVPATVWPVPRPDKDFFPLCVVWCPLPLLTWICPVIGHMGIVTSEGIIHDFGGPYEVNKHKTNTVFGRPTKYWPVTFNDIRDNSGQQFSSEAEAIAAWDSSIENASCKYEGLMHNLIWNNCHSHVAMALNDLKCKGTTLWCTLLLIFWMAIAGKIVSFKRFLSTYLGFIIISSIVLGILFIFYVCKQSL